MNRDEVEVVIELASRVFGEEYRRYAIDDFHYSLSCSNYSPRTLVAVEEEKVVGAVQIVPAYLMPKTYIICWLCVWPEHQHLGVGTALLKYALEFLSGELLKGQRGTVYLSAAFSSTYYARFGFVAGPKNHHDAAIMVKIIN